MKKDEIKNLTKLLDERTMKLMERESEMADQFEELEAQKEELTAAVEELVEKNKQLTERNQELDQILYRASHDLRSPVTSMVGVLNLLRLDEVPDKFKEYCNYFEKSIQQMQAVVNTLTLLGQSAADAIQRSTFDIRQVVQDEIDQLNYLGNFNLMTFQKSVEGNPMIYTDETLFRIVIKSLLSNAIIFRKPGKGSVKIHIYTQPAALILKVTDDGDGISPATGERIFEMFYRGSEKSVGLGMGLYLVQKIIKRLHGTVLWKSVDQETVFTVSIPLTPAPVF